jgi:hypothetical protein
MEQLLQEFEQPVRDRSGERYKVLLYGRSRPGDTWQGWLVFERLRDGERFPTGVETTQSSADGILYWATGLTDAYFDGAFARASAGPVAGSRAALPTPDPVVGGDPQGHRRRLAEVERAVIACFSRRRVPRLQTPLLFDELPFANADVVRALEDLEKQGGLLVRRTMEGTDWVLLTARGAEEAGLRNVVEADIVVDREPPRTR